MADKEERITIHKVLYPCEKCSINCNKNDLKYCDFYRNYISGITRQEAINRMAKAITCRACEDYLHEDTDPLTSSASAVAYSEAALNALLENKK